MDDKTFLPGPTSEHPLSPEQEMAIEKWLAPLDREIEELEKIINENAKLLGLPPLDPPDFASSNHLPFVDHPSASSNRR